MTTLLKFGFLKISKSISKAFHGVENRKEEQISILFYSYSSILFESRKKDSVLVLSPLKSIE